MADVSISKDPHKGPMALTKDVLASRILELHDALALERARREKAEMLLAIKEHRAGQEEPVHPARAAALEKARDADLPAVGSFHG